MAAWSRTPSVRLATIVLLTGTILFSGGGSPTVSAQANAPLAFEVASVRANSGVVGVDFQIRPQQFTSINLPVDFLIATAYGISSGRLVGAPPWVSTERFDIQAKSSAPATRQEMRTMLRTLLAERFQLKVHTEERDLDTYALLVTRPGAPGLHPVTVDCETNRLAEGSGPGLFPRDARPRCGTTLVTRRMTAGPVLVRTRAAAMTMENFATGLSGNLGRPVVDRTELPGTFDVELSYLTESQGGLQFGSNPPKPEEGPSLRDALREQLGFSLRPERNRITFLVVDSIERPTAD
jgi:uncharacterized protein (TIGR03435 family)